MTDTEIDGLIDDLDADDIEELERYQADLEAAAEIDAFRPGPKKKENKPVEQPVEPEQEQPIDDDEFLSIMYPEPRPKPVEQPAPDPRIIEDGDGRLNDVAWTIKNQANNVESDEAKLTRHASHIMELYKAREAKQAAEHRAAAARERALIAAMNTPLGRALSSLG